MARPRKPHGTQAAFRAHKREGTRICDACQAWKDENRADNPLRGVKITATPEFRALQEAAEAPKRPRDTPENPTSRSKRRIDPLAEAFDNLDTVQAALDLALNGPDTDIARVPALSKRKSELVAEIVALGGAIPAETEEKKLDKLLDTPTGGGDGGVVLGFRKAQA